MTLGSGITHTTAGGAVRRALVILALVCLGALGPASAQAAPIVVLDTLGAATTTTTFSAIGSAGLTVGPEQHVGPQFTLTQRTRITEIGGFLNNCGTITEGVPQCPSTSPLVVEVRRAVGGVPDPSGVVGSFTLSHDDAPLVVAYESAAPGLTLEPGDYFALFAPQGSDVGQWLGASDSTYIAPTTQIGVLDPTTGSSSAETNRGPARILGETLVGPPTSLHECKHGGWKTFNTPSFKNQGDCVAYVATRGRNDGAGPGERHSGPVARFIRTLLRGHGHR